MGIISGQIPQDKPVLSNGAGWQQSGSTVGGMADGLRSAGSAAANTNSPTDDRTNAYAKLNNRLNSDVAVPGQRIDVPSPSQAGIAQNLTDRNNALATGVNPYSSGLTMAQIQERQRSAWGGSSDKVGDAGFNPTSMLGSPQTAWPTDATTRTSHENPNGIMSQNFGVNSNGSGTTTKSAYPNGGGIIGNQISGQQGGLPGINGMTQTSNNGAAGYNAAQLQNANQWGVTNNQTAAGQMAALANPNNPYYQAWAAAGAQDAAARGFTGNSSLRDTAMMDSVMHNATPIATNDAGTYANAAKYNTDEANTFAMNNFAAQNTAGQFNAGESNKMSAANIAAATQRYSSDNSLAGTRDSNATSLANTASNNATSTANTSSNNQTSMSNTKANNDAQAHSYFTNGIAQIMQNNGMDAPAKATAIANISADYDAYMRGDRTSPFSPQGLTSQQQTQADGQADTNAGLAPGTTAANRTADLQVDQAQGLQPGTTNAARVAVKQAGGVDVSGQLHFGGSGGNGAGYGGDGTNAGGGFGNGYGTNGSNGTGISGEGSGTAGASTTGVGQSGDGSGGGSSSAGSGY